jgi:hypothetical protein
LRRLKNNGDTENGETENGDTSMVRYVGEQVDERLFTLTELDELFDNLEETLKRFNEVLEQAGGYPRVGGRTRQGEGEGLV